MDEQQRDPASSTGQTGTKAIDDRTPEVAPPDGEDAGGSAGAGPGSTGPEDATTGQGEPGASGGTAGGTGRVDVQQMLAQLQGMIDQVTVQASPALREVAAKAAELAAKAGERAGPLAQRAAEATAVVGQRVAERSSQLAADLRSRQEAAESEGNEGDGVTGSPASETTSSEEGRPPGA